MAELVTLITGIVGVLVAFAALLWRLMRGGQTIPQWLRERKQRKSVADTPKHAKLLALGSSRANNEGLGLTLLNKYYEALPQGWGHFFFRIVDDHAWSRLAEDKGWADGWRPTDVVARQDALDLRVPLPCQLNREAVTEHCRAVQRPIVPLSPERLGGYFNRLRQLGPQKTWNDPIWLLSSMSVADCEFTAEFYEGLYHHFLLGYGLLETELFLALSDRDMDVETVLRRRSKLLRLRDLVLPDGHALVSYNTRVCAGGICVTTASLSDEGYQIRYQVRSDEVAEKRGMKEALPAAIHTPPRLPRNRHVFLSDTVLLELAEEVFGKEMEENLKRAQSVEKPRRWFLTDHAKELAILNNALGSDLCSMWFTGWDIHELNGKYECAVLLVIDEPRFWEGREASRELKSWNTVTVGDREELVQTLGSDGWAGGGLFSLVNGLRMLKYLKGVDLPRIEVRIGDAIFAP